MLDNIELLCHSSIKIKGDKIIYFDPFKINTEYKDADIIFITHNHYDHFSKEDILKVKKEDTKIVVTYDLENDVKEMGFDDITLVKPNEKYFVSGISFETVPAYNLNKNFHKKEYNWVGYIIYIDDKKIYIAGDTDNIPEIRNIDVDIAFVPVGGTYTMNYIEASELIKEMKPKIAIPIHYKTIVGSKEDALSFKNELDDFVEVKILM